MSIDKILETAVSRDVITKEQFSSLQNIAVELSDPDLAATPHEDGHADEEAFYFSSGFGDMFLALGASMIFIGLLRSNLSLYPIGYFIIALIGWGLSEIFANWKKYTLSSIIGALGFVIGGALGITLSISNGFTEPLAYEIGTHDNRTLSTYWLIWNWIKCYLLSSIFITFLLISCSIRWHYINALRLNRSTRNE